jgi:hypothetical protein
MGVAKMQRNGRDISPKLQALHEFSHSIALALTANRLMVFTRWDDSCQQPFFGPPICLFLSACPSQLKNESCAGLEESQFRY